MPPSKAAVGRAGLQARGRGLRHLDRGEADRADGIEAAALPASPLKQVEALNALGAGQGKSTILLPANALDAFGDAFKLLKGAAK